jgi:alpha-glucosidase
LLLLLLAAIAATALAQTLARPGLAGSGLNSDPWWTHAVFYRTGDAFTTGPDADFKAIAAQLDTLQSLGVDALIVPTPPQASPANPTLDDFDELVHQASRRDIRILIDLPVAGVTHDLASVAQFWLNHGVAGFHVVTPTPATPQEPQAIVQTLRKVTNAAVGQRIVISDFEPGEGTYRPEPRRTRTRRTRTASSPVLAQLQIDSSFRHLVLPDATSLRSMLELTFARTHVPVPVQPPPSLLLDLRPPPASDPYPELANTIAALLLTTHPNALIDADLTDPTLAGWYRQLSALHHANATLRFGSIDFLNFDRQNALVWVRRAAPSAAHTPPVFVICNLSAVPVQLSLIEAVRDLKLRGWFLRTLLRSDDVMGPQNLNAVTLPPFAVYIGELAR